MSNPLPIEPLAVSIKDACRITGLGKTTLYELAKDRRLKLTRIGSRTLVPMSELHRLVNEAA